MTPVATLYFRVKFYVTDPSRLKEEFTRYQVYMQVKKDISEGRLSAPLSTICLLTSYVVQSTLGDFDLDTCRSGYLSAYYDLRKHSTQSLKNEETIPDEEMDRRVTELHKLHKNQSPGEAEMNFLEHAKRLEMYGIALHPGKDSHGRAIQLGVTCIGNFTKKVDLTEKVICFSKKSYYIHAYLISRNCKKLASIRSCNIPIKI